MTKEIEKKRKSPVVVALLTIAALAGLIRLIVKVASSDEPWEN